MSSRVTKRKVNYEEPDEDEFLMDGGDFHNENSPGNKKAKVDHNPNEELGRGKRTRKAPVLTESQIRDYEEELNDEYEQMSDLDNEAIEDAMKNSKTNFDAGQILQIEMKDFMCHRKFTVNLGRRLNFIVGKNGSGKSAIATALQLCLGATARNTGRGTALATFIREGSNGPASVKVTLVNEGADAYMPEVYGNRIIVERRIQKGTGAGGYHIYNAEKKEITTKKEDLEKILRCFNIYVDNPVCVLTQEESKKFVFGKETEKYEFFLKATGLFNLYEDLKKIRGELEETEKLKNIEQNKLEYKREAIDELQEKMNKFERIHDMEKEISISTAKIFWDEYREKKEAFSIKEKEIHLLQSELHKLEKEIDKLSASDNNSEDEIKDWNEKIEEINKERDTFQSKIDEKNNQLKNLNNMVNQLQSVYKENVSKAKQAEQNINEVNKEIEKIRQKMKQNSNDKMLKAKLEDVEKKSIEIDSLAKDDVNIRAELNTLNEEKQHKQAEITNAQRVLQTSEESLRKSRSQLNEIRSNNNRAALVADYMPRLLNDIRSNSSFRDQVYGPIGLGVVIKDGFQKYSKAIERVLGPYMRTFVVTNMQDANLLSNLQKQYERRGIPVFTQSKNNRYNIDKFPNDVLQLLDAIEIRDDLIFNALVDQINLDRVLLADNEEDVLRRYVVKKNGGADELKYNAVSAVVLDGTLIRYMFGNQSSEVARYPCRDILLGDMTKMIQSLEISIQQREIEYADAKEFHNKKTVEIQDLENRIQFTKQELMSTNKRMVALKRAKETLQEEISSIDEINNFDLSPLESEKEGNMKVLQEINQNIHLIDSELHEKKKELEILKKERASFEKSKENWHTQLQEIEAKIDFILTNKQNLSKKLTFLNTKKQEKELNYQKEFENLHELEEIMNQQRHFAMEQTISLLGTDDIKQWNFNPDALTKKENKHSLEKLIKELKYQIIEYKKEMNLKGYTYEILQERYNSLYMEYTGLTETLDKLQENYQLIEENQRNRQQKWLKALKESTEITKRKFDYYVQQKGSTGNIKFDHKAKTLEISYQVDYHDKQSKANDIRNLSGGERSFVTFSVLLALGHVIECPFRLLDEYDVFLDNISRRMTLDQLQSYVKRADQSNRQFIVITPHEVSAVKTSSLVKIIQMPEPVRLSAHGLQQQTLEFDK